jgi:hypothetical protein
LPPLLCQEFQDSSPYSIDHPKLNFVSQMDLGALRAGHLDLPIGEDVPAWWLVCSQFVGLYNLNPAGAGGNVFGIGLNDGHDIHELENQIARGSVRSEMINRADQHGDLCHNARIIKNDKFCQSGVPETDRIRLFAPYRFPQVACYVPIMTLHARSRPALLFQESLKL